MGPQYRPQYIIILIMGTFKMVPLILGNPHIFSTRVLHPETLKVHGHLVMNREPVLGGDAVRRRIHSTL